MINNMANTKESEFAIIFDMDGVLLDSLRIIRDAFNLIFKKHGFQLSDTDFGKVKGMSLRDQLKLWNKKYNMDYETMEFSREAWAIEKETIKNIKPDIDLISFLDEMKEKGIPMAVGTSSTRKRAEEIINILGLDKYMKTIITAEHVDNHKPHPETFLATAKALNTDPQKCVVIDDSDSGIEAAKRGDMKAIAFLTRYHTKEELNDSDLIIDSFSQISYKKIKELFK